MNHQIGFSLKRGARVFFVVAAISLAFTNFRYGWEISIREVDSDLVFAFTELRQRLQQVQDEVNTLRKEKEVFRLVHAKEIQDHQWDVVENYALNMTMSSFCLPWSVNSDFWWTHHPDWEIFQETDARYCFRLMEDEEKRNFMRQLYKNQFQGNSSKVLTTSMWSSGWGADMSHLENNLQYAVETGIPLQVHKQPWHYASPVDSGKSNEKAPPAKPACPLLNMYCYFLKMSNCEPKDVSSETAFFDLPGKVFGKTDIWSREYIVRQQTWLRHRVYKFI